MEPSENCDHLFRELGPPCFSLKWFYLPDKVVPVARMAKFCRTIRTTLTDNWNHLVGQLEPPCHRNENTGWWNLFMSGGISRESRVKSQESRVKRRVWDNIQKSKVKKETQHRKETFSQSSSYLNQPSNNCHVTRNMQQVIYVLAILIVFF